MTRRRAMAGHHGDGRATIVAGGPAPRTCAHRAVPCASTLSWSTDVDGLVVDTQIWQEVDDRQQTCLSTTDVVQNGACVVPSKHRRHDHGVRRDRRARPIARGGSLTAWEDQ